ncbi:MAG TPA: hypothetical protein VJP59_02750 [Gemmatimonadota bacterium]|nr:hypothetical protein [Gemmatimonadota bacterium]
MSGSTTRGPEVRSPVKVVFIAGSSYSGSTLLGLILGAAPHTVYAGELNQYRREAWRVRPRAAGHVLCSCGLTYDRCPFWTRVFSSLPRGQDLNPSPGFSLANLRPLLAALLGRRARRRRGTEYGALVHTVREIEGLPSAGTTWVVDSSKSLGALDELATSEGVDVRVIHVLRDASSVAGSFKKRGRSALYGMAAWAIGNAALRVYISRRRIRCLGVEYADLCEPGEAVRRIYAFIDLEAPPEDPVAAMRGRTYHLMGGSRNVRPAAGRLPFQEIRRRVEDERLSRLERLVARRLLSPLERLLLRGVR